MAEFTNSEKHRTKSIRLMVYEIVEMCLGIGKLEVRRILGVVRNPILLVNYGDSK